MLKLRGVNVFPEAIGGVVASERRSNGEYVCIVERAGVKRGKTDEYTGTSRTSKIKRLLDRLAHDWARVDHCMRFTSAGRCAGQKITSRGYVRWSSKT